MSDSLYLVEDSTAFDGLFIGVASKTALQRLLEGVSTTLPNTPSLRALLTEDDEIARLAVWIVESGEATGRINVAPYLVIENAEPGGIDTWYHRPQTVNVDWPRLSRKIPDLRRPLKKGVRRRLRFPPESEFLLAPEARDMEVGLGLNLVGTTMDPMDVQRAYQGLLEWE